MDIYESHKFKIISKNDFLYLRNKSYSTNANDINNFFKNEPRAKLSDFSNLKKAIDNLDNKIYKIGIFKPVYEIIISKDKMKAYLKVNLTKNDFNNISEKEFFIKVNKKLKKLNITTGIKTEIISKEKIKINKKILIAKGINPTKGHSAILKYFELSEKKPELAKDNKVNHYELNLIDNVEKGDWLGEKIPAAKGKNGKNIFGEEIPSKKGKDYKLKYDRKSIKKIDKENKSILIAKKNGAVIFKGHKISIDNHLLINNNVDYETGNIDFDGHVTINGTIKDNFKVIATKNIEINSKIGLGSVELIHSKKGNIVIKGGINGKNKSIIKAGKNIYTKYIKECEAYANQTIHIGLYSMDSKLTCKNLILDSKKGKIIGGEINAKYKIEANTIGNKYEKITKVNIKGFDREKLIAELKTYKLQFENLITKGNELKRKLNVFENNKEKLDDKGLNAYKALLIKYDTLIDKINKINREIESVKENLRTKGNGELKLFKKAYPKTMIEINNLQKRIKKSFQRSLYVKDNKIHHY